jgi:hypothetical protein
MSDPIETITITKAQYNELIDDQLRLLALQQSGVDNWDWYGDAMDQYRTWKEEANDKDIVDPDGEADAT